MKKTNYLRMLLGLLMLTSTLGALAETQVTDVLPKGSTTVFNAKYQYGTRSGDNWPGDPANDESGKAWYAKDFDDSSWSTKKVPFGSDLSEDQKWEGEYNCYWLRINFNLDAVDNTATYYFLCRHDDTYKAYINGNLVADRNGWTGDGYCYVPISGSYLSTGTNVIAVYIQQNYGGSYFDCGVQKYNYSSSDFDTRFKGVEVANGEYYLYNPASGLWLQNNDRIRRDWNTRGELGTRGLDFTLTRQDNGGYYLCSKFGAASHPTLNAGNRYLDTDCKDAWHFEKVTVPGLSNAYKVTYWPTDQNDYTLSGSIQSPTASTNLFTPTASNNVFLDCLRTVINDYCIWVLVSKEQRLAMMMSATNAAPQDATWLIKNADLADADDRSSAWEKTGTFTFNGRNDDDNTRFGRVYESYNTENVEFAQTIGNLPAGKYRMRVQGFYRGGEAKIFAGSTEQAMRSETTTDDMWTVARDMYYNGKYIGDWMEFTHNGGDLRLGIKKGAKATDTDWIIFSKFALEYMGTEGLTDLPFSLYAYNGNNRFSAYGFYSNLFDGDLDTKWEGWPQYSDGTRYSFADNNGNALFAASEPVYVNGLTLYTAGDTQSYPNRNPYEWSLYGTNDINVALGDLGNLNSWELIERVNKADLPSENKTGKYYKFNPSQTAYKYFRFHVNRLVGMDELQLAELELDYSTMPVAPTTMIANGGGYNGEGAENLFDGPSNTKWCRSNDAGKWVVFKTPKPIYASSYIVQTGGDAENRDPKAFKLYGALDAAPTTDGTTAGWTEIDSEDDASGTIPTDRLAFADFTIDAPGIYQYFMLKVSETRGSDNSFQLSELIIDNDEGYAIITSDEDMAEFASKVNSGSTSLNAFLLADVNSTTSAGTTTHKYVGTFDGQGHIVNLRINGSGEEYHGLIGCATGGAVIQNVITRGYVNGSARCGGILGGSQGSGAISITNCGNEASITATNQNAGGIHGCNNGSAATYTLTNCYNAGTVKGGNESAGISGWLGKNATVNNCYNIGEVTGVDGTKTFARWESGTYINCYNSLSANEVAGRTDSYPMDKVRSGELCSKLGSAFTQDLSQEGHPTFGSKAVIAGKWFNDAENDVYYNKEGDSYTVYQLNLDETKTKFDVPANVTAKNISAGRTITAGKWIGLCLPFDYDIPSGWDVRELTSVNGSGENASMMFSAASSIEAGKPYIVKTDADVTAFTTTDKTLATTAEDVAFGGVTMKGNLGQTFIPQGSFYISNQGTLKKLTAEVAALKGFRAYFTVEGGRGVKALSFDLDDDATAIEMVDAQQSTANDQTIYNVAGQRMSKVQKGINIINGKKILK